MNKKFIGLEGFGKMKSLSKRKPAHAQYRTHSFIKKRAVLAGAASVTAVMLSCVTVASALDASRTVSINDIDPNYQKTGMIKAAAAVDEVKDIDNPELFLNTGYSSLYIDGELIGTTNETAKLDALLDKLLIRYRKDYDDTTTTEFANDVVVEKHGTDSGTLLTAQELMDAADGKFSIALHTDWSYEVEMDYDTDVTYDEEQDNDYEKVISEGENGICEVTLRLTYVDGAFAESVVTDTKVIKEPVTEKVIRGSKQGETEKEANGTTGTFIWPLPHTHTIQSYFEWRWGSMHSGIDIAGGDDYGQPIVASDGGIVTQAGYDDSGYGNYVIIDHGNGYSTLYGHASEVAVSTGEYVGQGDVVAYVGSTGYSTGPHLHFEIRQGDEKLNPLDFVS